MLSVGAFDSFDMMALSYFHTALYGDGTRLTVAAERRERSSEASEEVIPLFEAIERSRRQTNAARAGGDDLLQHASTEDAHALMQRFTSRLFTDALNRAREHDAAAAEQLGDLPENLCYLGAQKHEYIRGLKYLITHENLHSASMTDVDGAGELVFTSCAVTVSPSAISMRGSCFFAKPGMSMTSACSLPEGTSCEARHAKSKWAHVASGRWYPY